MSKSLRPGVLQKLRQRHKRQKYADGNKEDYRAIKMRQGMPNAMFSSVITGP